MIGMLLVAALIAWAVLAFHSLADASGKSLIYYVVNVMSSFGNVWVVSFYTAVVVSGVVIGVLILVGNVDVLVIAGGVAALVCGLVGMKAPADTWIRELAPDFISLSIGVMTIDQLYQIRAAQQEKRAIIRQMGSRSHEFAIEAARIIVERGWVFDGSLVGADFDFANLNGVNLSKGELSEATFTNAKLRETHFEAANLQQATLIAADLQGAKFAEANLNRARLQMARLQGADLQWTDLRGAQFMDAILQMTVFFSADLRGTDFPKANMQGAMLVLADLQGANLSEANLQGANLAGANLTAAVLHGADLQGAHYDVNTIWPHGFDPRVAGAVLGTTFETITPETAGK